MPTFGFVACCLEDVLLGPLSGGCWAAVQKMYLLGPRVAVEDVFACPGSRRARANSCPLNVAQQLSHFGLRRFHALRRSPSLLELKHAADVGSHWRAVGLRASVSGLSLWGRCAPAPSPRPEVRAAEVNWGKRASRSSVNGLPVRQRRKGVGELVISDLPLLLSRTLVRRNFVAESKF